MENFTVLLVEDNPDDEFLAKWVLSRVGINGVAVAHDGQEALDLLCGDDGAPLVTPDLVLLDLRLPKIDGLEVLARLRGDVRTRNLPVAVLSSTEDGGDMDFCRRLGIIDFIAKPLKAAVIRRLLTLISTG
jgi:CheY-like chemotaxis protein